MTLPANLRINAAFPFPSLVMGSGPITIGKQGGIWTVGYSVTQFAVQSPPGGSLGTDYALVWDSVNGIFINVPLSAIATTASPPVTQTGAAYTVGAADSAIIINSTGPFVLTLPAPAAFPGRRLSAKQIGAFAVTSASANVAPLGSVTPGTAILSGAGKFAQMVSDATSWVVMAAN